MASRNTRSKGDKDNKNYSTRSRTSSKDDNKQRDNSSRRNRDKSLSTRDKDKDNDTASDRDRLSTDKDKKGSSIEQKSSVKGRPSVKDRLGVKNKDNDRASDKDRLSKDKDEEVSLADQKSSVKGRLSVKDRLGVGRKTDLKNPDKVRSYSRERTDISPRGKQKRHNSLEKKDHNKDRNKSKSPEKRSSRRSKVSSESSRSSRRDGDDLSRTRKASRDSSYRVERRSDTRSTRSRKDSEQSSSSRRSKSPESCKRSSVRSRHSSRNIKTEKENPPKDVEKEKCEEKEDEIAPAARVDSACDEFDAKFAIYSDVPLPNVDESEIKSFETIEDCIKEFNIEKRAMKERGVESVETEGVVLPKLERCFAPEQMMVPTSRGKKFRDVNTRMERFRGPLAQLREWREEKVRIKVWTRGLDQIRGTATAYIAAFDKHWNLALTDVDEQFSRLRQRKTWCPERKLKRKLLPADLPVEYKIGNSRMRVVKIQGKYELCVRHVPQVLLRGEHVVMVARATE